MIKIMTLLLTTVFLAYCSQKEILTVQITKKIKLDVPYVALLIILTFFCGLRKEYNDTYLYTLFFQDAPTVTEYWSTSPELTSNPFFYSFQSIFRHNVVNNVHLYYLTIAAFTNISFIRFIKKYSERFVLSMVIYFAIGLYLDTMGAMKQCIAIAILTYAVEALFKKKIVWFYIILLIAALFHTYAIFFVILPLFMKKPWTIVTYLTVFGVAFLLLTFESTITAILSAAEETGKNISEEELLDNIGINPFRLAVFAVPPILSFVFQNRLNTSYDIKENILMNMSILSFLVMSMGIFTAANLFGRSAGYFEIGSIIILPWIINRIFDKQSARFASTLCGLCYIAFFAYLTRSFSTQYASITISKFISTLF